MPGQGEGATPGYIKLAVEGSLRRLRTDYIDLYQLHAPVPSVPIGDTLEALDNLVRAGKVREIGCSNFSAEQIREATRIGAAPRRPLRQRAERVQPAAACGGERRAGDLRRAGHRVPALLPARERPADRQVPEGRETPEGTRITDLEYFQAWITPERMQRVEGLARYAESRGRRLLDLTISWLLARNVVASVIAGATSAEQVKRNALAASWKLSRDDLAEVNSLVPR